MTQPALRQAHLERSSPPALGQAQRCRRLPPLLASCAALLWLAGCQKPGETDLARGNVLASQRKLAEALEAYAEAARKSPSNPRPRELAGHVLLDLGRLGEARKAYEEAASVDPRAIEARIGLARLAADAGKLDEALQALTSLLGEQPGNLYALLSRANLAIRSGDAERAVLDTAEAMKIDARNPSVLYTRGSAFIAARRLEDAAATFDLLRAERPDSPLAAYGHARVAAARGDRLTVLANLDVARKKSAALPNGWRPDEVRADPAFQFLKDDEEFNKILNAQ